MAADGSLVRSISTTRSAVLWRCGLASSSLLLTTGDRPKRFILKRSWRWRRCFRMRDRLQGLLVFKYGLTVAGNSAGGCLLAGALHHMCFAGWPLPEKAVFIYPIVDASLAFPSYVHFCTGYHLTTARVQWYWKQYLGMDLSQMGGRLLDPYISPLQSPHLHRFPSSLVVTAAFDPLHDEGVALVKRLHTASVPVPVQHINVPGEIHGFLRFRKALTDSQ